MKNIFTIFFIVLSFASIAQPTLTSANVGWNVGDSFQVVETASGSYNVGTAGPIGVYDFSSCTGTAVTVTNLAPDAVSGGAQFNANIAQAIATGGYSFVTSTSTDIAISGIMANGVSMNFSDPMSYIKLPMLYNGNATDNYAASFTSNGVTINRSGNSTFTADGYGTMHLPWGTVNNVLRVHFTSNMIDDASVLTIDYVYDGYYYFAPGYHVILASVMTITSNGTPDTTVQYLAANPVGVEEEAGQPMLEVYPNPTNGMLTWKCSSNVEAFSVYNQMGLLQKTGAVQRATTHSVDVSELPCGVYFYQAIVNNRSISGSFIKE
jgi:Secretion system C-terminal sorting domain